MEIKEASAIQLTDTVAALATPPGQGGIAVVRLSGPASYRVAAEVFKPKNTRKSLENAKGYTALYGEFFDRGGRIDEGIALCFRAPHSYTGENVLELSCHGGEAVSRALLNACIAAGAAPAPPGEFTRRALLNGRLSLTQAEAVMELIGAASKTGAAVAQAAQSGALHRELAAMKERLTEQAAHLAAWTDYPEEDVEPLDTPAFSAALAGVLCRLDALIAAFDKGALVRRGVTAVIAGRPNVGKSTLFNLLSGQDAAIVTPVAGTTRDVLREELKLGGAVLRLADTAGLHEAGDEVEKEGIKRTKAEIEAAQLLIAVFDGSQSLREEDLDFARLCAEKPAIALLNKNDLGRAADAGTLKPFFGEVLEVCALHPRARAHIESAVTRLLGLQNFDPDAALLFNARQLAAAQSARAALSQALGALAGGLAPDAAGVCLTDALRALAQLSGEDATEAVLNEVFSKFCVGK